VKVVHHGSFGFRERQALRIAFLIFSFGFYFARDYKTSGQRRDEKIFPLSIGDGFAKLRA
jgi:hypothetical protein